MKLKLRLLYKLFLIVLLFSYGLIIAGGLFPLLKLLCSINNDKNKRNRLKTHWLKLFSAIMNLDIVLEGKLPQPGTFLVSNHISWLDIIIIGQYLPAYFVAKSDILSWPIIGYLSRQGGTVFIRRGDKKHIKATTEQMLWILKQNNNIIAFPEGTTTQGDDVLSFHASLFQPALLTKSAIQPVALQYYGIAKQQVPFVGDDDFLPHLIKMLSLDKIAVRVSFLPVINSSGSDRQSVSIEARELILKVIANNLLVDDLNQQPVKSAFSQQK
ncbi:lysophospholipid acyltransferase family protein [Methylobacter psychrophilus]|uniref:lysophospholipid acyltransferase family protein n=1 Tax=Methylobacter psychrophilus TaxID=96941 RepID=UPI0021D5198C|nr:lysophospholipid acyltransferase family protein [Methylobacter psychrophilus]